MRLDLSKAGKLFHSVSLDKARKLFYCVSLDLNEKVIVLGELFLPVSVTKRQHHARDVIYEYDLQTVDGYVMLEVFLLTFLDFIMSFVAFDPPNDVDC